MMKYAVISNLLVGEQPDYKGVKIENILAALYPESNTAYIVFDQDTPDHIDLLEITESDYLAEKERLENLPKPKSEIDILREENEQLKNSLADLWELQLFGGAE